MNILHNQHKHLLVANRVAFMIIGVLEASWHRLYHTSRERLQ